MMECPFCGKVLLPLPANASDAKPQNDPNLLLLKKLIPEGYSAALTFARVINVIGWLVIVLGCAAVFEGCRCGEKPWAGLLIILGGIVLLAFAVCIKLMAGMARDQMYLADLKEYELNKREGDGKN